MKNAKLLLVAVAGVAGCSFYTQPALPRRATIERADSRLPIDELRAVVDSADILYLPVDRLELDEKNGAAVRLLNVLQQSAARVTIAWANITAETQPLFDQWNGGQTSLDALLDGIRFRSASQREAVRRLLREAKERAVPALPIACDTGLSCTAENIERQFRALGNGKLLVVVERRDLDPASGLPFLVGERLQVRQVVLDLRAREKTGGKLLTAGSGASEIVNAAPRARSDRL